MLAGTVRISADRQRSVKSELMPKTCERRGETVERRVAKLSSVFFMKDFIFRSPSYLTSGEERQVTDLMFLLNRDCMLVSVKGTDGQEKTATRLPLWAAKKASQATKNAK